MVFCAAKVIISCDMGLCLVVYFLIINCVFCWFSARARAFRGLDGASVWPLYSVRGMSICCFPPVLIAYPSGQQGCLWGPVRPSVRSNGSPVTIMKRGFQPLKSAQAGCWENQTGIKERRTGCPVLPFLVAQIGALPYFTMAFRVFTWPLAYTSLMMLMPLAGSLSCVPLML